MGSSNLFGQFKQWLNSQLFLQKLNTPLGYAVLPLMAIVLSYLISIVGLKISIIMLGGIIGIPFIVLSLFNHQFGISILVVVGFLVELIKKHNNIPTGMALDALLVLMLFGLLIKMIRERDYSFAKGKVSYIMLVWIFYNFIQIFNPWAPSKIAWVFTFRSMGLFLLVYYVACHSFKSMKEVKTIIKVILAMSVIAALYGLKQEFIGFSDAELAWLYSDPDRFQRIFQWSRLRIFGFFSNPTTYGTLMAYMGTFCFVMATGPFSNYKRFLLITGGLLMFMAMAYAGSRTPFVLVPFGLVVFTMLTLKKEILIAMGCFFFIGTAAVLKSTSNPVIYRLQSAFIPSRSDDTMDVRFKNQKFIQPFIYRHPFGAGLGSCGDWGKRFSPDTMLANFAHDSGFVRVAVELGWVGLILYSYFLFTVLQTSVYYYLRVKDPTIKVFYLSIITIFFQLVLASYPQEVIIQLPNSIIFLSCLAAVYRMKDFDEYYMSGGKILPIEEKVKEEKLLIQEPVSNDII